MSQKTRKCPVCKKEGYEAEMVSYPEKYKRLLHKECKEKLLNEKAILDEEKNKREQFWNTFVNILNIETKDVPRSAYEYGMNLRNGNKNHGRVKDEDRRNKAGYEWDILEIALKESGDDILYSLRVKNFNSVDSIFRYLFAIIANRVVIVDKRIKQERRSMEIETVNNFDMDMLEALNVQSTKTKKTNENDISAFLDDEDW